MIDPIRLSPAERRHLENLVLRLPSDLTREFGQSMLEQWLLSGGKVPTLDRLRAPLGYERRPVSMTQFLEDSDYLHGLESLWPPIKRDLIELFDHPGREPYVEAVIGGSIGGGKSTLVSIAYARMLYELSCLEDPASYYGLMPGSFIYLVNQSVSRELAKKVVFEEVKGRITQSPYFKEYFRHDIYDSNQLTFPSKRVQVLPLAANEGSALGLNVFGGVIDEINFLPRLQGSRRARSVNEVVDVAERMYNAISKRLRSRFMKAGSAAVPGKIFMVSSAQYEDDFTERKRREAEGINGAEPDRLIFTSFRSIWESKPGNPDPWTFPGFSIEVGGASGRPRLLTGHESPEELTGRILEVPMEFLPDFRKDIVGAVRDIAGMPTSATSPFIGDVRWLRQCIDADREHPFSAYETNLRDGVRLLAETLAFEQPDGKWKPKHYPNAWRYVHIDYALSNDECGLAMGCAPFLVPVERRDLESGAMQTVEAPYIHIDVMLRIVPPPGEQIDLADVRAIVYTLQTKGFLVKQATLDSFQSAEAQQEFRKRGIRSETMSVDTDMGPYLTWREALQEGRCRAYEYAPYLDEATRLEVDRAKRKVDHPPRFDKGITDAVASVVQQATVAAMKGGKLPVTIGRTDRPEPPPEVVAREDFLHELVEDRVQHLRTQLLRGQPVEWKDVGRATRDAMVKVMDRLAKEARGTGNFALLKFVLDEQRKLRQTVMGGVLSR